MPDNSLPNRAKGLQDLDALGGVFIGLAVLWTLFVWGGAIWMVVNRQLPSIRIRNVPLALGSLVTLHLYWVLYMLAYPLNGILSCAMEFWVMDLILPFGIALFQANNLQLLSVATMQQRFVRRNSTSLRSPTDARGIGALQRRWNDLSLSRQTGIGIGIGMVLQLLLTLFIFLGSRKFHRFGLWSKHANQLQCRQGPEWIPSMLWQVFWSWIFAPYILYKIRRIQDVHYWRLQTTLCIIAGLIGFPMWIGSLYSPLFRKLNKYWAPPSWFLPGIMMMEIATIFFPIYEVMTAKRSRDRALIAAEPFGVPRASVMAEPNRRAYSAEALDEELSRDPSSLIRFAAMQDFSGENIMFLIHVRDWKDAWTRPPNNMLLRGTEGLDSAGIRRHLFNVGVEIYATYISMGTAEFPVNLEAGVYRSLYDMFGQAAGHIEIPETRDTVAPFNSVFRGVDADTGRTSFPMLTVGLGHSDPGPHYIPGFPSSMEYYEDVLLRGHKNIVEMTPPLPENLDIPEAFNNTAFDEAVNSIWTLVHRDTWPKFLASRANDTSSDIPRIRIPRFHRFWMLWHRTKLSIDATFQSIVG